MKVEAARKKVRSRITGPTKESRKRTLSNIELSYRVFAQGHKKKCIQLRESRLPAYSVNMEVDGRNEAGDGQVSMNTTPGVSELQVMENETPSKIDEKGRLRLTKLLLPALINEYFPECDSTMSNAPPVEDRISSQCGGSDIDLVINKLPDQETLSSQGLLVAGVDNGALMALDATEPRLTIRLPARKKREGEATVPRLTIRIPSRSQTGAPLREILSPNDSGSQTSAVLLDEAVLISERNISDEPQLPTLLEQADASQKVSNPQEVIQDLIATSAITRSSVLFGEKTGTRASEEAVPQLTPAVNMLPQEGGKRVRFEIDILSSATQCQSHATPEVIISSDLNNCESRRHSESLESKASCPLSVTTVHRPPKRRQEDPTRSPRPSKVQPHKEYEKQKADGKRLKKIENLKKIRAKLGIKHKLSFQRDNTLLPQAGALFDPFLKSTSLQDNIMPGVIVSPVTQQPSDLHCIQNKIDDQADSLRVIQEADAVRRLSSPRSSDAKIYTAENAKEQEIIEMKSDETSVSQDVELDIEPAETKDGAQPPRDGKVFENGENVRLDADREVHLCAGTAMYSSEEDSDDFSDDEASKDNDDEPAGSHALGPETSIEDDVAEMEYEEFTGIVCNPILTSSDESETGDEDSGSESSSASLGLQNINDGKTPKRLAVGILRSDVYQELQSQPDAPCTNSMLAEVVEMMVVDQAERGSNTSTPRWIRKVNKKDVSRKEATASRKNVLHRDVRCFAQSLRRRNGTWRIAHQSKLQLFAKTNLKKDGPRIKKFRLDLESEGILTSWNKRAAEIFVDAFLDNRQFPEWSDRDRDDILKAFTTHLITIKSHHIKARRIPEQDPIVEDRLTIERFDRLKEGAHDQRRRNLCKRRYSGCNYYADHDPLMREMMKNVWVHLDADCMSGDETDHGCETQSKSKFNKRSIIRKPSWREELEFDAFVQVCDALYYSTRFDEDGRVSPGRFPFERVPSNRLDPSTSFPKTLPSNLYSKSKIEEMRKSGSLDVKLLMMKGPVQLIFSADVLRIAARFLHIKDRTSIPLPADLPELDAIKTGPASALLAMNFQLIGIQYEQRVKEERIREQVIRGRRS